MRLSLLPSELLGFILGLSSFGSQYAHAGPTVNVALQASFNAPPYILELLLVTLNIQIQSPYKMSDIIPEKQPRKKTRLPIFPFSTESLKDALRNAVRIKTCIALSYRSCVTMGTLQMRRHCLPFNLLCQYTPLLLG